MHIVTVLAIIAGTAFVLHIWRQAHGAKFSDVKTSDGTRVRCYDHGKGVLESRKQIVTETGQKYFWVRRVDGGWGGAIKFRLDSEFATLWESYTRAGAQADKYVADLNAYISKLGDGNTLEDICIRHAGRPKTLDDAIRSGHPNLVDVLKAFDRIFTG